MANFLNTIKPTPFSTFDSDAKFQLDADKMVVFILRRLGEDILSVELTNKQIWANFEESARLFNGFITEYQAVSNLANILGMPTGSLDANNNNIINLSNVYIKQNVNFLDDLSSPYAGYIGFGNSQMSYSGSITLREGIQDYNYYTQLVDYTGTPIANLQPSGSLGKLSIYEVFQSAPVQYVYNSNLASNFIASGLPVESYIPDTRFYVLPLFEDVLRASMLESAQRIRKSHYSYKISGDSIRIFPTPQGLTPGINDKLWMRVGFKQQPLPALANTLLVSGTLGSSAANSNFPYNDQSIFGVNGIANAPFGVINYSSLNDWARIWIAECTLAISMIQLGYIRSKMKTIPIPGGEVTLNGEELVSHGREDLEKLKTSLKEKLENLTYSKLAEQETLKMENTQKMLSMVPVPPSVIITMR